MVALFAATNFLLIRFSCLGEVDHHILEAIFPPLFLWISLQLDSKSESRLLQLCLGCLLFFSLTVSSSSLFALGAFFVVHAFILGRPEGIKRFFVWCVLPATLLLLAYTFWFYSVRGVWLSIDHPSLFQTCVLLVLFIAASLVIYQRPRGIRPLVSTLVGLAAVFTICFIVNWPVVVIGPLKSGIEYVFGKTGVLQNVGEASSIFTNYGEFNWNYIISNFGYLIFLLPLGWFALFYFKALKKEERALLLWLSLMSVPSIMQKRFSHLMLGLLLIFYVWLLRRVLSFLSQKGLRLAPMVTLLFLILTILPLLEAGLSPLGSSRDRIDGSVAKMFLDKNPMNQETVWKRLALKENVVEGFWANPNLGHMMLYITGLGAVTNSFYHGASFDLDFKLRTITSDEELLKEARLNKIRFFILADDFRFLELAYRLRGQPTKSWLRREFAEGQERLTFEIPELRKLAWVRLLTEVEKVPGFTPIFSAKALEEYYYTYIKTLKVDLD